MLDNQIKHNLLNFERLGLIHCGHVVPRLVAVGLIFANQTIYFVNEWFCIGRVIKLELLDLLSCLLYPLHFAYVGHVPNH